MKNLRKRIVAVLLGIGMILSSGSAVSAQEMTNDSFDSSTIELTTIDLTTREISDESISVGTETPENSRSTFARKSVESQMQEAILPENYQTFNNDQRDVRAIIGTDNRTRVTNTTSFPYSAICSIHVTYPDGSSYTGTGTVISRKTVMTAAHVIYNSGRGGFASRVTVSPGRNGTSYPLGTYNSTRLTMLAKYATSTAAENDVGFINVGTNIGSRTGIMGYGSYSDASLNAATLRLAGYPGDKTAGTLWTHTGKPNGLTTTLIRSPIDTTGGQSGSPLFMSNNQVVGIHCETYNSSSNTARRVDYSLFLLLQAIKAEDQ